MAHNVHFVLQDSHKRELFCIEYTTLEKKTHWSKTLFPRLSDFFLASTNHVTALKSFKVSQEDMSKEL